MTRKITREDKELVYRLLSEYPEGQEIVRALIECGDIKVSDFVPLNGDAGTLKPSVIAFVNQRLRAQRSEFQVETYPRASAFTLRRIRLSRLPAHIRRTLP